LKASLFLRVAALAALSLAASPAAAAEPRLDIADLFPPGTLAYAELTNPSELSPQLAAVFKGTVLEDSIPLIHGRKDQAKTLIELQGKKPLAGLGLLCSPEMLAEFKKLQGIAIGLTGFTEQGEPEITIVVLTGDSQAAGLAARAFLTMSTNLRRVSTVSKVPVFQYNFPNINYDPNGQPILGEKTLQDGAHEPTFAYTPGLFVAGTSKNAISFAIKRFLGEEKGTLRASPLFKEAEAAYRRTGLFFYVNVPEFINKCDIAFKLTQGLAEPDLYAWMKMIANPRAVRSLAGNISFRDGGLAANLSFGFDMTQRSPLFEYFSGTGARVEHLDHARRPAMLAFTTMLPERNRSAALIGLLDAMAKANGDLGALPGEIVKELDQKEKMGTTVQLLGKTRAFTVVLPPLPADREAKLLPTVVLHTEDAAAATAWEEFFPKLIAAISGNTSVQASAETIDGVKVSTLPTAGPRWNSPLHYARSGTVFVIGPDRKQVAASALAERATSVKALDAFTAPVGESAAGLGLVSLGDLAAALLTRHKQPGAPGIPGGNPPILPNGMMLPESVIEDAAKAQKALVASLATLSPATVVVRKEGNELRIELFQPRVQNGGLKGLIDAGSNWLDRVGAAMTNENGILDLGGRAIYGKW
jgi:hypothetical protein